jgi:hypothetical protein
MDPVSKVVVSESAFDVAFSKDEIVKCGRRLEPLLSPEPVCKTKTKSTKRWVRPKMQQTTIDAPHFSAHQNG